MSSSEPKLEYEKAKITITHFEFSDLITTSPVGGDDDSGVLGSTGGSGGWTQ